MEGRDIFHPLEYIAPASKASLRDRFSGSGSKKASLFVESPVFC